MSAQEPGGASGGLRKSRAIPRNQDGRNGKAVDAAKACNGKDAEAKETQPSERPNRRQKTARGRRTRRNRDDKVRLFFVAQMAKGYSWRHALTGIRTLYSSCPMNTTDANDARRNLGIRIRRFRRKRGLSLRSFALMVGVNHAYLHDIESGRANPTVTMLAKIAAGLGVRLKDLFDFD